MMLELRQLRHSYKKPISISTTLQNDHKVLKAFHCDASDVKFEDEITMSNMRMEL